MNQRLVSLRFRLFIFTSSLVFLGKGFLSVRVRTAREKTHGHSVKQLLHNLTMEEETSYSMFKCPVNTDISAMTPQCLLYWYQLIPTLLIP